MSEITFISIIAENLDRKRLEFTNIRRIVHKFVGTPLESAAVRMAIPMIYALWEGYVKEVCQLYLEYIESNVPKSTDLNPALLGYMWTPILRRLSSGLDFSRKVTIASLALSVNTSPVAFNNKEIDTKSNLNFKVLSDISKHLCLDISSLRTWENWLNILVNLRNNIAHGAGPTGLSYSDLNSHIENMLSLMESFENVLSTAITTRAFCSA